MDRRDFLAVTGLGLAHPLVPGVERRAGDELYLWLVAQNDERLPRLLGTQEARAGHAWIGGVPDGHGIHSAGATSGFVRDLVAAWAAPESRFAGDEALIAPLERAARYLLAAQHADGTIDLHTTNFHSPPDTGFVLEHVCTVAQVLATEGHAATEELRDALLSFVRRGARALAVGGIHTPNHRWVVCMALARAHALEPDEGYVERADRWLAEGIDIDPDGQFTERSTSIYSPLTDRCLITVARLLGRPELLEPVRKNLAMTTYYVHADGEIATEGSRRQDQYRAGSLAPYHYPYRYLANLDRDGVFTAMTRLIESCAADRLTGDLIRFLEDPGLRAELPPETELPVRYARDFAHSALARVRHDAVSATILAGNPTFLAYRKGSAAVSLRFASAFFGKGQFAGEALERDGEAWVLEQRLSGPYFQPLPAELLPGDGDWSKMDRAARPESEVQHLTSAVRIEHERGAVTVTLDVAGTERVPVAVELGFRPGGRLEGVRAVPGLERTWLLDGTPGNYRLGADTIRFGPGRAAHEWTRLRGALPQLEGDCVYLTGFTPFRSTLVLS